MRELVPDMIDAGLSVEVWIPPAERSRPDGRGVRRVPSGADGLAQKARENRQCKYWLGGKGCPFGADCRFFCHKDRRTGGGRW